MRFHRHSVSFRSSETGGFQVELWNCSLVERLPVRFWLKRSTRFTRKVLWHPRYCRRLGPHGRPVPQGGHPEIEIFKTRKNMSLHHRHMMTHDLPQQVDFCVFFAMLSTLLSPEMLHQHQPQEDGSWQQRPTYQWSGATRFSLRPPVDFGIPKLHGSYSFSCDHMELFYPTKAAMHNDATTTSPVDLRPFCSHMHMRHHHAKSVSQKKLDQNWSNIKCVRIVLLAMAVPCWQDSFLCSFAPDTT